MPPPGPTARPVGDGADLLADELDDFFLDVGSPSHASRKRVGEVLRGTMKKIADGEPWAMPATIDDPAILDEINRH